MEAHLVRLDCKLSDFDGNVELVASVLLSCSIKALLCHVEYPINPEHGSPLDGRLLVNGFFLHVTALKSEEVVPHSLAQWLLLQVVFKGKRNTMHCIYCLPHLC